MGLFPIRAQVTGKEQVREMNLRIKEMLEATRAVRMIGSKNREQESYERVIPTETLSGLLKLYVCRYTQTSGVAKILGAVVDVFLL